MIYLLDTNIFVETKKRFAPISVGQSFWAMINRLAVAGTIASIDKVKDEIDVLGDDLTTWSAAQLPHGFYLNTSTVVVMTRYARIINWANTGIFTQPAKDEFARNTTADAFLIAFAATDPQNIKIVTYETSEPARRNKVKIPDAAASVGVSCITLVEMMNELGVTF